MRLAAERRHSITSCKYSAAWGYMVITGIGGIAVAHRYHSAHRKSATSTRPKCNPKPRFACSGLHLSSGYAALGLEGYKVKGV